MGNFTIHLNSFLSRIWQLPSGLANEEIQLQFLFTYQSCQRQKYLAHYWNQILQN